MLIRLWRSNLDGKRLVIVAIVILVAYPLSLIAEPIGPMTMHKT